MNLVLWYIIAVNALTVSQDRPPSLKMFFASSFSVLCSLLTLLGTVEAQNSSFLPSTIGPPTSSVVSSSVSLPPKPSSLSTEPSPTSLGLPPVASGFSRLGNVLKPTITPYTFDPFPTPSESPIPGVFPETWPDDPPPVGDPVVPNFGLAWENAYEKAREMVSGFLTPQLPLPCKLSPMFAIITDSGSDTRREG